MRIFLNSAAQGIPTILGILDFPHIDLTAVKQDKSVCGGGGGVCVRIHSSRKYIDRLSLQIICSA